MVAKEEGGEGLGVWDLLSSSVEDRESFSSRDDMGCTEHLGMRIYGVPGFFILLLY